MIYFFGKVSFSGKNFFDFLNQGWFKHMIYLV